MPVLLVDKEALLNQADRLPFCHGVQPAGPACGWRDHYITRELQVMIVRDPLERLERTFGVDDPSLDIEQIHVPRYLNPPDNARDSRFDSGREYQRRGIFEVLCDHRLSQLKQFHGMFA